MSEIRVVPMTGSSVKDYIPDLARLRIEVFREFPYLYDGTPDYESRYLETYIRSPGSVVVVAFDGNRVIGASTALPMAHENDATQGPFRTTQMPLERIFYLGESVLEKSYRGRGIGVRFFEEREAHARRLGGYDIAAFCAVERPATHPRRPTDYRDLHAFWGHRGYVKQHQLTTSFSWRDLDEEQASAKTMVFWTKQLT